MPRGGARVNSGPPPEADALRRDRPKDKDGWIELPSEGYAGQTPAFPLVRYVPTVDGGSHEAESFAGDLADDIRERELDVWNDLWATPQASAWARYGWRHEIGIYVRCLVLGERGDAKALSEMRQWSDRLGLNPAAMARLRWRIVRDQVADAREGRPKPKPQAKPGQMRNRLNAVTGGGA